VVLGFGIGGIALLLAILLLAGLGGGSAAPAANNACIELMPHRVSTISGIRGMFRQSGSALSITITTLILHSFGDMRLGFNIIFIGLATILLLSVPIILMMPRGPATVSAEMAKTD